MTTFELFATSVVAAFGVGMVGTILWYELRVIPTLDRIIEHYRHASINHHARVSQLEREHRGTPYSRERVAALLDLCEPDTHNASRKAPVLEVVQ